MCQRAVSEPVLWGEAKDLMETSPLIGLHSKVRSQELNTAKPDLPYLPLVQNVKQSRSIR